MVHRAHAAGAPGQLAVYRIVLRHSVEERLLQLADRCVHTAVRNCDSWTACGIVI
jgi:hypothetical protein